ncbi:MAG: alpha/beta fold hydrolase [Chitinophagales bacterium]
MKLIIVSAIFLLGWIVFAQYGMKLRISDTDARRKFLADGVQLSTGTASVNGFNMHYAKTGNDTSPTILFIHGSPGSWIAYEKYMKDKDLLAKFRMISIDRPGFGYSEFGKARNLKEQSRLISPLLDIFKNNKPLYIAGHSMGGPMTVRLVIDNPGVFSGMILLSAAVDPEEERPEKWRHLLLKPPFSFFVPGAFLPSDKELWWLKKDLWQMQDEFNSITCPVWIVHGDKDVFVPVGNADFAKKRLVNAKSVDVEILHGANHFIQTLRYNEIKEVLLQLHP